jgi:outer membrane protein TolC
MKRNIKFKIGISAIFLILCCSASTQNVLTKVEAVEVMLENNFGIKVAKNNVLIAENNSSKQNNGYLPTVNATAGGNSDLGSSNQKFNSGNEATVNNAFTWGVNAAVSANYTLYDKRRSVVFEQMKELVERSNIELRQTIELNMLQLFNAYYQVALLTESVESQMKTIELSNQRLERAKYRYEYGQGIRLDVLNAEVDIQRDSIDLYTIQQQVSNSKRNLNVIMGREVGSEFEIDTSVSYIQDLSLEDFLESFKTQNADLILSEKNLEIFNYDLQVIEAEKKPTIGTSAAYDFNFQKNAAESFITSSNNRGLALGLNVSWNIFDGGRRKIQKQNTEVAIQSQLILRQQMLQELERDIINAWENYQNSLFILKAEKSSLATNALNFERTEELYKSGQVNSVEFRQAQLNLLNAETSYNIAKYNTKLLEIQMYQLSGGILDYKF